MFLTNGPTGGNAVGLGNGQGTGSNENPFTNAVQNGGNWDGYHGGGSNGATGGRGNGCYNCGKPRHIARDCWARKARGDTNPQGDPELEEIKKHFRVMRKERLELEEKRRLEDEKRAKEEEELRRNLDFAHKAEEFKLQLRAELLEEWRKNNQIAKKASGSSKKPRRRKRGRNRRAAGGRGRSLTKKKKKVVKSSDETDSEETIEDDSSEDEVTTDSDESRDQRTPRGRKKKPASKHKKGRAVKGKGAVGGTPPKTFERGECSEPGRTDPGGNERFHTTEIRKNHAVGDEARGEPKTPLTGSYKGLAAECSQKGLIDYCISAHKIFSAKKADVLRKICEQKGVKYTTKPEVVEILARQQVQLAYDGFEEDPGAAMGAVKTKASGSPRKGFSDIGVPRFVRNSKNISRHAKAGDSDTIRRAIDEGTKHLKGSSARLRTGGAIMTERKTSPAALTDEQVREWGMQFDGLVLTPVDRNQGDTAVFCPVLYRHGFGKIFAWNSNYVTIGKAEDEAAILKTSREDFLAGGLDSIGKWRPDGRLGTTYMIPKHKDLARWRPIAPAPADPVSLATKRTARALHCLLIRLPANNTFNSVGDLAERLNATTQRMRSAGCNQVVGRCYDIKEMFSRIPHEAVIKAAHQLMRRYEDDGCRQVKVSLRGKLCVISQNKKKTEGYVGITLKKIMEAIRYDLMHAVVKCGDRVVKQVFGIPMGKSTSTVLAQVTCAMAELQFIKGLGSDRSLVAGWRLMDDITIIVGSGGPLQPDHIFTEFEDIYDAHLEIVRKDECGLTWPFVGGQMFISGPPLGLHYVPCTKNTDSLHEKGVLLFQTMQDYDSYSTKCVKKGVLLATLRRLWDQTTSKQLLLGALAFAVCEADLRGYPPEVSLNALANLAKAVPDRALHSLHAALSFSAKWGKAGRHLRGLDTRGTHGEHR
ncbi:hypothetical protein CBR_g2646 [Chara braunii]|uniref:CCHC-type domain-containing protein n=1 Tax=Chara braunii TaxID=69332 RepID=A0A388KDL6_CHABU|nr:hypothetical protein CBR_g2646 [Chara braunii]|eukprot:GBG68096.1 hypothetical protein CBR_g2646 [Chara braunii]